MASTFEVPSKYADSTVPLVVDFISQLIDGEALVAATTSASVFNGTDPAPEDILLGSPDLAQNVVTQTITGGLVGVTYTVQFNGTTNLDNELIINVYVSVINSNPFQTP